MSLLLLFQYEAIPESLKNMLLVMSTQGVFDDPSLNHITRQQPTDPCTSPHDTDKRKLWSDTWNRIDQFLPSFLTELFPSEKPQPRPLRGTPPSKVDDGDEGVSEQEVLRIVKGDCAPSEEFGGPESSSAVDMVETQREESRSPVESPGCSPSPSSHSSPPAGSSPGQ